jgi:hypothetical protein
MPNISTALPPLPPPDEIIARMEQLMPHADDHISGQHTVSAVILRRFTEPWGAKAEELLAGLNIRYVNARPSRGGPDKFGKVRNFVQFASRLLEKRWQEAEDKLHGALSAIEDGTLFDDLNYVEAIRDIVVLHFVRSIPMSLLHEETWHRMREAHRRRWLQYPVLLHKLHYQRFGFYAAGPQRLEAIIDDLIDPLPSLVDQGALFRVSLDDRFCRFRQAISGYGLELFTPECGEFLIGDVPALTIRHGRDGTGIFGGVGLANADEIVLPLGPHWMAVLGNHNRMRVVEIPQETVRRYNIMQVQTAYQHVHFRPSSGLENLVRCVDRAKD